MAEACRSAFSSISYQLLHVMGRVLISQLNAGENIILFINPFLTNQLFDQPQLLPVFHVQ